jgi:hypothetical protein
MPVDGAKVLMMLRRYEVESCSWICKLSTACGHLVGERAVVINYQIRSSKLSTDSLLGARRYYTTVSSDSTAIKVRLDGTGAEKKASLENRVGNRGLKRNRQ